MTSDGDLIITVIGHRDLLSRVVPDVVCVVYLFNSIHHTGLVEFRVKVIRIEVHISLSLDVELCFKACVFANQK